MNDVRDFYLGWATELLCVKTSQEIGEEHSDYPFGEGAVDARGVGARLVGGVRPPVPLRGRVVEGLVGLEVGVAAGVAFVPAGEAGAGTAGVAFTTGVASAAAFGGTFAARNAYAIIRENAGAATRPPKISVCGSSRMTIDARRGLSAGANPANDAM
jgi:hypothetical protein